MTDTERWVTRVQAAELLSIAPRTIDTYVRDGRLPRFHLTGSRTPRFRIEDVRALVVPNGTAGESTE
jgi:predicted site-specific integrase-resolvase